MEKWQNDNKSIYKGGENDSFTYKPI